MRLFDDLIEWDFPRSSTKINDPGRVKACIRANQEAGKQAGDRWITLGGNVSSRCVIRYISDWVVVNEEGRKYYAYTWFLNGESYQRIITDIGEQERYVENCPDDRP